MSFMIIVLMIIFAVIFRDIFAKIPGWIVGAIDAIGHMPAKRFAIIVLIVAGIVIILKKK